VDVALGPCPRLNNRDLSEALFAHAHLPSGRLFHAESVPHGEITADAGADKLTADGALEDTVIQGQDTLQGPVVLPRSEDAAHCHTLMLHVDRCGVAPPIRVIHLKDHVTNVIGAEVDPTVVSHTLGVSSAPEQGRVLHVCVSPEAGRLLYTARGRSRY
jgi:hypothetical protein